MSRVEDIRAYAKLLIETGLNIQKGQTLVISAPVDCATFVRMCVSAAYDCGCREVITNWSDDYVTRQKYLRAADEVFDTYHSWMADLYNKNARGDVAWLSIHAADPENLTGVDPDRIRRASITSGNATRPFREQQMSNGFAWCVASVPSYGWARKVFPDMYESDAVEALWDAILFAARIRGSEDAATAWKDHTKILKTRVETLNSYNLRSLHYTNSLGTDLTVELPENHIWAGGDEATRDGIVFAANIPTEEVFTLPKRDGVNGTVYASMPLILSGNIVTDFAFTFKDGKIADIQAGEREKALLEAATSVDEGASYLGEVALVPYNSPISKAGILFYNTLFDENASCHLAFGDSYPCFRDAASLSKEDLAARGANSSMTHNDFMVGTADLSIVGTTRDGRKVPIFVDGNFAF